MDLICNAQQKPKGFTFCKVGNQNAFRFLVEVAGGKFAKHKVYSQNLGTQLQPNFLGGERVNSRLMTMINDLFLGVMMMMMMMMIRST